MSEICDLIDEAKDARIRQLEEEKRTELNTSLLKKIPECPVNMKLYVTLQTNSFRVIFPRFVSISSSRISRSTTASSAITSVDPARTARPSR